MTSENDSDTFSDDDELEGDDDGWVDLQLLDTLRSSSELSKFKLEELQQAKEVLGACLRSADMNSDQSTVFYTVAQVVSEMSVRKLYPEPSLPKKVDEAFLKEVLKKHFSPLPEWGQYLKALDVEKFLIHVCGKNGYETMDHVQLSKFGILFHETLRGKERSSCEPCWRDSDKKYYMDFADNVDTRSIVSVALGKKFKPSHFVPRRCFGGVSASVRKSRCERCKNIVWDPPAPIPNTTQVKREGDPPESSGSKRRKRSSSYNEEMTSTEDSKIELAGEAHLKGQNGIHGSKMQEDRIGAGGLDVKPASGKTHR